MKRTVNQVMTIVMPVLAISVMTINSIHAGEGSDKKTADQAAIEESGNNMMHMPPPPPGPYRSQQYAWQQPQWAAPQAPVFDRRQWTPPTPPQWNRQPPNWANQATPSQPMAPQQMPPQPQMPQQQMFERPDWANQQVPQWVQQQRDEAEKRMQQIRKQQQEMQQAQWQRQQQMMQPMQECGQPVAQNNNDSQSAVGSAAPAQHPGVMPPPRWAAYQGAPMTAYQPYRPPVFYAPVNPVPPQWAYGPHPYPGYRR